MSTVRFWGDFDIVDALEFGIGLGAFGLVELEWEMDEGVDFECRRE
jgi:hypothetical protein